MQEEEPNPYIRTYSFSVNEKYINKKFTDDEKILLRPIAETLALLDGNAFFTMKLTNNEEWYEQYLPEAATVFYDNGGLNGWAGEASWIKIQTHETDAVKDAYDNWKTLKKLSQEE